MRKYLQFTLPALLSVALYGVTIFFFILPRMEEAIMAKKRETTRELVRTIIVLLETYQQDVDDGVIQIETAKKRALKRIQKIRYGPEMKDYFWINDLTPRMIMHPYRSDLDTQDLANFKDPNGKKVFVEVVREAIKTDGGFVEYLWQHHDDPNLVIPKISYVYLFKPWGWVIGSGLYYDDVGMEINRLVRFLTFAGFGVFVLVTGLSIFIAWRGMVVIKEKQRIMESLKRSEAKFRGISANAPDGIIMMTPEGTITFWNQAAEKIFGYVADEIIGKNLHKLLAPAEQYKHFLSAASRFRLHGTGNAIGKTLELPAVNKNGQKIPIELSISALNFDDEWHAVGIVRDVTEKKKAEAALQESEIKYHTLFDATNDIMLLLNNDVIVDCNARALEYLQMDKANVIGLTPLDFSPEFQAEGMPSKTVAKQYIYEAKSNKPQHFEWIHQNIQGEPVYTDVYLNKITLLGKKLLLAVCRDITQRKKTEEQRRTLEMQLQQAQKMEAIGTLAAGIAHDFNNVLWGILGFGEMAITQIESEPEKAKYSIERVLESGNRAKYMVQQILQFSRQSQIAMGPLDLTIILKEVVKLLKASVPSNFEIRLKISEGPFRVHADATQIHQVLINLCTNAYHAMRQMKKGVLSISLDRIQAESEIKCHSQILNAGSYICIKISDTGQGIETEYLNKIFDPYYTTKEQGEGTGLGLSISFSIIKSHKGGLHVESLKGEGSTFFIYLPPKDDSVVEIVSSDENILGGTERILFVDDESVLLEMTEISLEKVGYSVTGFNNSLDALNYFSAHPDQFDLIITDQTMPKLTGLELSYKISNIRPLPIILCTGFSETITGDDLKSSGISLILKKPLLRKELTDAIRRVLNGAI
ncbi:MAG: PAS domain S-box protein [Proteobacteria bacterium]|nr:PAS domain S-box protein [Pseudomonadota bacterium]